LGSLSAKPRYSAGDSSLLGVNGWKIVYSVRATSVTSVNVKSL
jgi:hypothetical protein